MKTAVACFRRDSHSTQTEKPANKVAITNRNSAQGKFE